MKKYLRRSKDGTKQVAKSLKDWSEEEKQKHYYLRVKTGHISKWH